MKINDNVIELNVECIYHCNCAYTLAEVEKMFWSGELTGFSPINDAEFCADDYFDFCDKCERYINK